MSMVFINRSAVGTVGSVVESVGTAVGAVGSSTSQIVYNAIASP